MINHRESSNRVFKLQFDARRVVCCSQNKVIVGWDFANGDAELKRVGSWSLETC
jgi:F-box and WD-40 domain protein 1/11